MKGALNKEKRDGLLTFVGFVLMALSVYGILMCMGTIAQDLDPADTVIKPYKKIMKYGMVLFLVVVLFLSTYTISQSNVKLNKLLAGCAFIFLIVCFIQKDEIEESLIKDKYSEINELVIKNPPNVEKTELYKEFKLDKENNNKERLKHHYENKDQYINVDRETVMNLKLFYSSIKNEQVHQKLGDIFKDDLVSKHEYEEFKKFLYDVELSNDDKSLLSVFYLK